MSDQWLVRTTKNEILGPFSKPVVCEMVLEGKLNAEDEVCPASGFWFYLHEHALVMEQLGVKAPLLPGRESPEESTLTDSISIEIKTSSQVQAQAPTQAEPSSSRTVPSRAKKAKKGFRIDKEIVWILFILLFTTLWMVIRQ